MRETVSKLSYQITGKNGFLYKRINGSHQVYHNPATNKTAIVPVHGNRDLKKGTFFAILKQAGIQYE